MVIKLVVVMQTNSVHRSRTCSIDKMVVLVVQQLPSMQLVREG